MDETTKAYLAGIIDGEGYIGIIKLKPGKFRVTTAYNARLQVRMSEKGAVYLLKKTFGGGCHKERAQGPNRKPMHAYCVSNLVALRVIRGVLPYLRVKNEQAEAVIRFCAMKRNSKFFRTKIVGYRDFPNKYGTVRKVPNLALSDEYVEKCEEFYQICKRLNAVGVASLTP